MDSILDSFFFLLCHHGVGTFSFIYYLNLNGDNKQKIIQIICDPIDEFVSYINKKISDSIFGYTLPLANKNSILEFMTKTLQTACMFTSIRNSVASYSDIFYIDTKDISGVKNCQKTMYNVSQYLSIQHVHVEDKLYSFSYNSFKNRLWLSFQEKKHVIGEHIDQYISQISILHSEIHDFGVNTWHKAHILDVLLYNNKEYIISLPESEFGKINSKKTIWSKNKIENTKKYLDIFLAHKEFLKRLYRKYVMTWEELVSLIRSEPRFRSRFLRLMEHEISLPLKNVPEKV